MLPGSLCSTSHRGAPVVRAQPCRVGPVKVVASVASAASVAFLASTASVAAAELEVEVDTAAGAGADTVVGEERREQETEVGVANQVQVCMAIQKYSSVLHMD